MIHPINHSKPWSMWYILLILKSLVNKLLCKGQFQIICLNKLIYLVCAAIHTATHVSTLCYILVFYKIVSINVLDNIQNIIKNSWQS